MSDTAYLIKNLSGVAIALALLSGLLYQWTGWIRYRTAALMLLPAGVVILVVGNYVWGFADEPDDSPYSRLSVLGAFLVLASIGFYLLGTGLAAVPGQPPYTVTLTTTTVDTLVRYGAWATLAGIAAVVIGLLIEEDITDLQPTAEDPPEDPTEILEKD